MKLTCAWVIIIFLHCLTINWNAWNFKRYSIIIICKLFNFHMEPFQSTSCLDFWMHIMQDPLFYIQGDPSSMHTQITWKVYVIRKNSLYKSCMAYGGALYSACTFYYTFMRLRNVIVNFVILNNININQ